MTRKILHLDLDAFYCCVEELRDPSLRGKPFAVGGRPDQRGVVASCSYAARQFGVRSAMPMSRAVRDCPDLIVVPHDFKAYRATSAKVMAILREYTDLVEQLSIDEAFLDISALPEPAEDIAKQLQARINTELTLPCSLGVASNKLLAKIANNLGKDAKKQDKPGQPPNAILVVPPGREAAFLAPLPTRELWGVGPKTAEALAALGVHTIGDLAHRSEGEMLARFGKHGALLWQFAHGLDDRPVETERETKSISRETTFVNDVRDAAHLRQTLQALCTEVSEALRKEGLHGSTIKIKLRWSDFRSLTRQTTLVSPVDDGDDIYKAALRLLDKHRPPERAVRLLGVGVSHFSTPLPQLSLWSAEGTPPPPDDPPADQGEQVEDAPPTEADQKPGDKAAKLKTALAALRDRFGETSVKRASDLRTKPS
jgi:DNA polymerase-4